MIRSIQFVSVFLLVFCTASGADGGFLIELKGGAEIVVNHYWEVEGEIRYFRYGGFVGLPAGEVKDIRPTDRPVESEARSSRASGIVPAVTPPDSAEVPPGAQDEPGTSETKDGDPAAELEEFRQRADQLRFELSSNIRDSRREINNIEDAKRASDGDAEQAAMARLKILVEEQTRLNSEIELLHVGSLPPWWFEIMERR